MSTTIIKLPKVSVDTIYQSIRDSGTNELKLQHAAWQLKMYLSQYQPNAADKRALLQLSNYWLYQFNDAQHLARVTWLHAIWRYYCIFDDGSDAFIFISQAYLKFSNFEWLIDLYNQVTFSSRLFDDFYRTRWNQAHSAELSCLLGKMFDQSGFGEELEKAGALFESAYTQGYIYVASYLCRYYSLDGISARGKPDEKRREIRTNRNFLAAVLESAIAQGDLQACYSYATLLPKLNPHLFRRDFAISLLRYVVKNVRSDYEFSDVSLRQLAVDGLTRLGVSDPA
tara:strand:+ start:8739 stop:9590 length:852 start_codon:yes stop_codon:yes gene_type:complete